MAERRRASQEATGGAAAAQGVGAEAGEGAALVAEAQRHRHRRQRSLGALDEVKQLARLGGLAALRGEEVSHLGGVGG